MGNRRYWTDLFTVKAWQEYLDAGGEVSGFREKSWSLVQQIKMGDYLLAYLVGVSRWIGVLEVVSEPFRDDTAIWSADAFICRVRVKPVVVLTPETAIPARLLQEKLSVFQQSRDSRAWGIYVRRSPTRCQDADGEAVVQALLDAEHNPVSRPIDKEKLKYQPRMLRTREIGPVTIPEDDPPQPRLPVVADESTAHTEIQWLLLQLGSAMGMQVWVARNDRGRMVNGKRLGDVDRAQQDLPVQFDEATNRTIELIDVLWLRGNAIVAAFEIESTTSIYSGLLRMSDLIAMQPNLNIALFLVAPDERRAKVLSELNRPTFTRLSPPLNRVCRFIPFSVLRQRVDQIGPMVRYLKPEFLDDFAETCIV